jgi:sugar/nucleoside kinase (ribokinase family)
LDYRFKANTRVGPDFPSEYREFLFRHANIDVSEYVSETPTTRFRIDRTFEPRKMWLEARCDPISELQIEKTFDEFNPQLLLAVPVAGEIDPQILKRIAKKFKSVCVDSQGFVRKSDPASKEVSLLQGTDISCLDDVAYLKGDKAELNAWTGFDDLEKSLAALSDHARHSIVTAGRYSVDLYEGRARKFRAKPPDVIQKDTTGAGDIMMAAFAASLGRGQSEKESLRFALAAASLSVSKSGIQKAILDREDVERIANAVEISAA